MKLVTNPGVSAAASAVGLAVTPVPGPDAAAGAVGLGATCDVAGAAGLGATCDVAGAAGLGDPVGAVPPAGAGAVGLGSAIVRGRAVPLTVGLAEYPAEIGALFGTPGPILSPARILAITDCVSTLGVDLGFWTACGAAGRGCAAAPPPRTVAPAAGLLAAGAGLPRTVAVGPVGLGAAPPGAEGAPPSNSDLSVAPLWTVLSARLALTSLRRSLKFFDILCGGGVGARPVSAGAGFAFAAALASAFASSTHGRMVLPPVGVPSGFRALPPGAVVCGVGLAAGGAALREFEKPPDLAGGLAAAGDLPGRCRE